VGTVVVQGLARPRLIQRSQAFVQAYAAAANPELDQIARWRDAVCVQVVGLDQGLDAKIKGHIEDVARSLDLRVKKPGCSANIEIVFSDQPQGVADAIAKRREYLLGYYHAHDRDRLKTITRPIQAWYVTATSSENPFNGATAFGLASFSRMGGGGWSAPSMGVESIDDADGIRPPGCGDAPPYRSCMKSLFHNVLVVADSKALEGKDAGLIADYMVMLTLSQARSLDGCNSFPSVIDLFAKAACPGRDAPDGLTPADAAYLTALYKADLEARKHFQVADISGRMADILTKANALNAQ
jgi:hypothetical protein